MSKKGNQFTVTDFEGCQLQCIPACSLGLSEVQPGSLWAGLKRSLAVPWNYHFKQWFKKLYYLGPARGEQGRMAANAFAHAVPLGKGDRVRVRSLEEIKNTLDPFGELKGCAFLREMEYYTGTDQRVFKVMRRFLDERDYKVKKTKGIILLENVFCNGTPVFGECDRSCLLFWREEWVEKIV